MRLNLPFFENRHRALVADLAAWCRENLPQDEPADVDARCRELVSLLGAGGWLRYCVVSDDHWGPKPPISELEPPSGLEDVSPVSGASPSIARRGFFSEPGANDAFNQSPGGPVGNEPTPPGGPAGNEPLPPGGPAGNEPTPPGGPAGNDAVPLAGGPAAHSLTPGELDVRSICLIRETLAYHNGLADFAFAMQGLGSGAITLAGAPALREHYLPRVAAGELIAAFALSEPQAGSDVAAMTTTAECRGDEYILNGTKTWISNGGIADFYVVFARTEPGTGARGISAFVVPASAPGLHIAERIEVIAPHPLALLRFQDCAVPASHLLGEPGGGFKLAMQTLDIFRASVAAAALGFARRALDEAVRHAQARTMFGQTLADMQITQAKLAQMATDLEAAALLTYQAAWLRDVAHANTTCEVAMAKMQATESAQRIIDSAVQLFGAWGVTRGHVAERLYREIRALRIYEGATEVQQLIIARSVLKGGDSSRA